jgi:diguanylate cyclase (GGDEF)-like protein
MTLSHRALTRFCMVGLATVLLFMAAFAVAGAFRINAASHATSRATQLADAYERARYAVGGEESLERKYRLEPGPEVLSRFDRAAGDYAAALGDAARAGSTRDRALVSDLRSRQRAYRAAIGRLFAAADAQDARRVLEVDEQQVDPLYAVISTRVDAAASANRVAALHATRALSEKADAIKLATPVAFVVGMGLLAIFALVLVKVGRREVLREAEHGVLSRAALEDSLTGLSNRRKLAQDLDRELAAATASTPLALVLLDLDGFKLYNDAFGHPAGDVLLARLGQRLRAATGSVGEAYRLGGDEFCVLAPAGDLHPQGVARLAADALSETGEGFIIGCSYGIARLPQEAASSDDALLLADQRLYASKPSRRVSAQRQSGAVLLAAMTERHHHPLAEHDDRVARLAERLAEHRGLPADQRENVRHAAQLHDVGKVAIPDEILNKPGALTAEEWVFIRQHTLIGERILSAAPALAPVAKLVRSSHERFDGTGYPDRLAGEEIPIGARIIAACDAFAAMIAERPYHAALSQADAISELERCAGTQFDPAIIAPLIELLCAPPSIDDPSEFAWQAVTAASR